MFSIALVQPKRENCNFALQRECIVKITNETKRLSLVSQKLFRVRNRALLNNICKQFSKDFIALHINIWDDI